MDIIEMFMSPKFSLTSWIFPKFPWPIKFPHNFHVSLAGMNTAGRETEMWNVIQTDYTDSAKPRQSTQSTRYARTSFGAANSFSTITPTIWNSPSSAMNMYQPWHLPPSPQRPLLRAGLPTHLAPSSGTPDSVSADQPMCALFEDSGQVTEQGVW